ncbi:hypothetical protein [Sphingobacterium sp. R2]|uniref:hypothetical protein n=1 Tax=Sphingobacterium sp. R2 TaxID=3112958 RepID=UPI00345CAB23
MGNKLKLPATIRLAKEEELPKTPASIRERWHESQTANILEGYTIKFKGDNPDQADLGFAYYAEININNDRLWPLMKALSESLPEVTAPLFGHIDSDLIYGRYHDKEEVIDFLEICKIELAQDTFFEFGLLYHDEDNFAEIFVDQSKYIKYWGTDKPLFERIMKDFGLAEIEGLEFIDEYPKVREPLRLHLENCIDTSEMVELFREKFA